MNIYLFNNNTFNIPQLMKEYKDLRSIWYDGESKLIEQIGRFVENDTLIIDNHLSEKVESLLIKRPTNIKRIKNEFRLTQFNKEKPKKICIVPSNDTHVFSIKKLVELKSNNYFIWIDPNKNENAYEEAKKQNLKVNVITKDFLNSIRNFDGLLVLNDWGFYEKKIIWHFKKHHLPTFCLQESIIEFNDKTHRMEWADFSLIQGLNTVNFLSRSYYLLTGNPRYENLKNDGLGNNPNKIFINCNFTYGIYESVREKWLNDVIACCDQLSYSYLISQHPRDTGDLGNYINVIKSSANRVQEDLQECWLIITRFSSLINEAIALNKFVIFYNPHNENVQQFDGSKFVRIIKSKNELLHELSRFKNSSNNYEMVNENFANYHYGSFDNKATNRIHEALNLHLNSDIFFPYQKKINKFTEHIKYNKLTIKRYFSRRK